MRQSSCVVLDASAAAELIFNDAGARPIFAALSEAIAAGRTIVGPSALLSEVQAVIAGRVRRETLDSEGGRLCSEFWRSLIDRMPIQIGVQHDHHHASFEMSLATGHSYYECLYLTLARALEGELLTCDPSLARKANDRGIAYRVPVMSLI